MLVTFIIVGKLGCVNAQKAFFTVYMELVNASENQAVVWFNKYIYWKKYKKYILLFSKMSSRERFLD